MAIQKVEWATSPKPYEIVGVAKTNYRSGQRYELTVCFTWKVVAVGSKFQGYTDTVTVPYDKATETLADLKVRGVATFNALKAAATGDADLVFALMNLAL